MQLNRMETAVLILLRDHPDELRGPQSFVDKLVEAGMPPARVNIRDVNRALKKLHRIGFVETRTMQ